LRKDKHSKAPLLSQRESYLTYLLHQGVRISYLLISGGLLDIFARKRFQSVKNQVAKFPRVCLFNIEVSVIA